MRRFDPDIQNVLLAARAAPIFMRQRQAQTPEQAYVEALSGANEPDDPLLAKAFELSARQREQDSAAAERRAEAKARFDEAMKLRGMERENQVSDRSEAWSREDRLRADAQAREDRLRTEGQSREDTLWNQRQKPVADAQMAELAARVANLKSTTDTRTPEQREKAKQIESLQGQLAGLEAQEDPQQAAATLRQHLAVLTGQPAARAAPRPPGGMTGRERRETAAALRAKGDFESAAALESGSDPQKVPAIAAERAAAREAALRAAAEELDVGRPLIFGQGEPWQEESTWAPLSPAWWKKDLNEMTNRAALLLKAKPQYAVYGITPEELAHFYKENVD